MVIVHSYVSLQEGRQADETLKSSGWEEKHITFPQTHPQSRQRQRERASMRSVCLSLVFSQKGRYLEEMTTKSSNDSNAYILLFLSVKNQCCGCKTVLLDPAWDNQSFKRNKHICGIQQIPGRQSQKLSRWACASHNSFRAWGAAIGDRKELMTDTE